MIEFQNDFFSFGTAHFKWFSYYSLAEPNCFAILSDYENTPKD